MGLLNIYNNVSKLRPHITYRFCAEITPFSNSSKSNTSDAINFTIKSITFPTFNIANDTKRLFGNTQVSFPTIKFGEREMSIVFEESDDMLAFKTLSNYYTGTPYFHESLPLINIKITQFDESMTNIVDEKTYVCRIKQFDFPTFNNNEYGSPISLKASFYVLYSTSDEKSIDKIEQDESGKIKHKETHDNYDTIFNDYMNDIVTTENEEDFNNKPTYRNQVFAEQYKNIDERRRQLMQTITRQLIDIHKDKLNTDASYKERYDTFKKSYNGENNAVAELSDFLNIDLKNGYLNNSEISVALDNIDEEKNPLLERALLDLSDLNDERVLINEEEMSYVVNHNLTTGISTSTKDFIVSESELNANLKKIHDKGYKNVSMETLRTVSLENAQRMENSYNSLTASLKDSNYSVKINTYNDSKHGVGIGSDKGSHLLGQKIDLTFYKDNQKITMQNATAEDRAFLSNMAKQNGLIINWESDGNNGSGWGDAALSNAMTINKQGKIENINIKKWGKDDSYYDSSTDSHRKFKQ